MAYASPSYVQRQLDLTVDPVTGIRVLTLDIAVNAEEGSGGSGTVVIDDPAGNLDVLPLKVVGIYEPNISDADARYIWVGYAHKRRYFRGENFEGPLARSIGVELYDLNEVLSRRLIRKGDGGNRPAETADERLAWIFATPLTSLVDDDTTYVDTAGDEMDANDYTGQYVMAVLEDIGEATQFNYFLTWTGPSYTEDGVVSPWGKYTLVFCDPASDTFKSTARLTNDPADIDNTTTFGVAEAEVTFDPDEVYDGALVPYKKGSVYLHNEATETAFALGGRDTTLPSINVSTAAKATARGNKALAKFSREERRGKIVWYMRPEKMHLIKAGHAIDVKFTHLPDLSDDAYTQVRLVNMHLSQSDSDTALGFYRCEAEFTMPIAGVLDDATGAAGILYRSAGPHDSVIWWDASGDLPEQGLPPAPTTGLIEVLDDTGDADRPFRGFKVTGTGTIDVELVASTVGVLVGSYTVTWGIAVNGTVVASVTRTPSGFLQFYSDIATVTGTAIAVVPDDEITGILTCTPGMPFFGTPSGAGQQGERLVITGANLV